MNIAYLNQDELKKQILAIFSKHLPSTGYKIFFFGSRVRGDNFPRSDIDIGIEGTEALSPEVKLNIEEELERLPTLYKIDVVDFSTVSSEFRQEAEKYKESIH